MAQAFLIQKSGGGGVNQTLPEQVTAFHAAANSTPAVVLTWTNPTEYFGGVLIVKKIGSAPTSPTDGEKIYSGTAETFTDADVQFDTKYFYRAFAYNAKKQYQTLYAVASATPVSGIALSELAEGALVNINEGGKAVPFYLAKHNYESGLNGAGRQLMVRKDIYDTRKWESSNVSTYATSDIDAWQNGDYKAKFSKAVQALMGTTKFYYTVGGNDKTLTTLKRAVFLLSATELGLSSSNANNEGTKLEIYSLLSSSDFYFWTRSPHTGNNDYYVHVCGPSFIAARTSETYGSRPCFTLPATALVNPTPNADGSYNLLEVA